MTTDASDETFEGIDWSAIDSGGVRLRTQTKAFLAGLALVTALFCYDHFGVLGGEISIGRWQPTFLDWLLAPSLLVLLCYVVFPLAKNRRRTARYWRELRRNRLATASFVYVVAFLVVGVIGPIYFGRIHFNLPHQYQPPLFFTVENPIPLNCVGEVVGGINGRCHGSLAHPLGTNRDGKDMIELAVSGMRVAVVVALVTSMIIIPVATAVGTIAGYLGGWVDELLMRYVDVQQAVPAFIVYLMVIFLYGRSLFLFVLVFGLFNWGGVARLVRGEVLTLREASFTTAARNAGASRFFIIRRHILPNLSGTVVTATTRKIPALILAEAAISFLNLNDIMLMSWGEAIAIGLQSLHFPTVWWSAAVPVVFLSVTVLAFSVFGDALRDLLDSRYAG